MLRNIAPKGQAKAVHRARSLRATMSLPEVFLWRVLRTRPDGLKFRRQHATGPYILDFFCSDARLAIEVDGAAHDVRSRALKDEARDRWLAVAGIETLRLPASAVLSDLAAAVEYVVTTAIARMPLHHPAAPGGPPPRAELGED